MGQTSAWPLSPWLNFYEIVGSAAGALTGLQFVVVILIAQVRATGSDREIRAFGTPTVMQFCAALLVSGIMSAPWEALSSTALCLTTCAIAGFIYSCATIWHAHKAAYNPDTEDWIWYVALPLATYATLTGAAILMNWHPRESLFAVAGIALLFLFIGIHNSWDTVTYIALRKPETQTETKAIAD